MKILIITLLISLLVPNISFGQISQEQIRDFQRQIQLILIQIQNIQRLLQRSLDIKITMPEKEIKKEDKKNTDEFEIDRKYKEENPRWHQELPGYRASE